MKKIIFAVFACSIFLMLAPSIYSKAAIVVGNAFNNEDGIAGLYDAYIQGDGTVRTVGLSTWGNIIAYAGAGYELCFDYNGTFYSFNISHCPSVYIPTLNSPQTLTYQGYTCYITNDENDYYDHLPPEYRPEEPSAADVIWDAFYELYYDLFGFYPLPGSLFDLLRGQSVDDEEFEIVYPTMTPSPTPSPTPTPIPVQTIFVPDGNGNTTIIYQYPDPTSGVITQSPYNPNIENNITINCYCDGSGGSSDNTFDTDPQDPYTLTSSMLWADGFGVEIYDNPLTAANESQQTLAEAAADYSDDVKVLSNSFNILPAKWITLVGLLGGILIIAGLIRTFLGG